MRKFIIIALACICINVYAQNFPKWKSGYLDIHQISTRSGNATFIILPDGTTLLVDAGDLNKNSFSKKYFPLKVSPSLKDSTLTTGKIIKRYLDNSYNRTVEEIDYFILTHFHSDHFGEIRKSSPLSPTKRYLQTGVSELGDLLRFKRFLVRDYPKQAKILSNSPETEKNFGNLLRFIEYQREQGMEVIKLKAGALNQIRSIHQNILNFSIRNIKVNNQIWNGIGENCSTLFPYGEFSHVENYENSLSAAFVIQYGNFRYYFGGDNTGLHDQDHPVWFDCETPMSKVIGRVDAMVVNHHGNRDATNRNFIERLDPRVVIMPTWCSDQPGAEVGMRLISPNIVTRKRDIFMTYYQPDTSIGIGAWFEKNVTSKQGHICIRVDGDGHYKVYVLDDESKDLRIKAEYSY